MKATELRIGNWVCNDFTREDIEVYPMMIHRLSKIEGEHHIKPIPLTEEWLIKFGFVREGMLTMRLDKFTCYCEEDDYIDNFCLGHIELFDVVPKYVHQLQNLYFALTGKELTIKKDE